MNRFAELLDRLAYEPGRNNKLRLIAAYFREAGDPDRGFALAALTGALSFKHAKPGLIRDLIAERTDPVLFGLSYDNVGDLSETVVEQVRARLPRRGMRPALISKIETASAVDNLAGIINAADGVMVARGDLGIQMLARRVPLLQKEIIRFCNQAGKPVITATQMLESMTRSPLPTRSEVNVVANAVLDGTDALMLSEETAVGLFPGETVRMMSEVAESAEGWPRDRVDPAASVGADADRVAWALAHAAVQAAEDLGVAAILCPTRSGQTAHRVAAFRPRVPIAAISPGPPVLGGLCLVWGVRPLVVPENLNGEEQIRLVIAAARAAGIVREGDLVALVFAWAGPGAVPRP